MRPGHRLALTPVVLLAALSAACSVTDRRGPASPAPTPVPAPPPNIADIPDPVPRAEPRSKRGNPPFYDVLGKRYFVLPSADGYVERGVASWYGPTFHGGTTSMGEPYDMYKMTAAHKTLPLPTYARVTNLSNGRSVVVRINDRGPFVGKRIIDVSYTAAHKLDMVREGTTMVEVRALLPGQPDTLTRTEQSPSQELYVQAGAFSQQDNALRLQDRLRSAGIANTYVVSPPARGPRLYRVRIGPVADVAEFDSIAARLAALGVPDARLASD